MEIVLSAAALVVSVVSFLISYFTSRASERRSWMPVLVFVYDDINERWILRNVGNGPALNVLVAQAEVDGDWSNPTRVPPISRDGEVVLTWIKPPSPHRFGATYKDFLGGDREDQHGHYTVTCEDDLNRIRLGMHFPEWPEGDIDRYWDIASPQGKEADGS